MAPPELALLDRFYEAFDRRDGATMAACYAPDARFSNPVFTGLRGKEPGAMWRMLTGRSADLSVELVDRAADTGTGSAHWIARYTFGQTGRPVVNDVHSTFRFADGLIADQRDDFDFARWGPAGAGRTRPAARLDALPARPGPSHGAQEPRQLPGREHQRLRRGPVPARERDPVSGTGV